MAECLKVVWEKVLPPVYYICDALVTLLLYVTQIYACAFHFSVENPVAGALTVTFTLLPWVIALIVLILARLLFERCKDEDDEEDEQMEKLAKMGPLMLLAAWLISPLSLLRPRRLASLVMPKCFSYDDKKLQEEDKEARGMIWFVVVLGLLGMIIVQYDALRLYYADGTCLTTPLGGVWACVWAAGLRSGLSWAVLAWRRLSVSCSPLSDGKGQAVAAVV